MGQPKKGVTVYDRLVAKTSVSDSCWLWGGLTDGGYGYGVIKIGTTRWRTHRLSYVLFKGNIPKGMYVCHTCDMPACINPFHLFLGTAKDNAVDMTKKGRNVSSKKTHCQKGHPYSKENTYIVNSFGRNPTRVCRRCYLDRSRLAGHKWQKAYVQRKKLNKT